MHIVTFASGSSGNCTLVRYEQTNILIDAGISMKRIRANLACLGLVPGDIDGVLITHEHSDHVSGLKTMTRQYRIPIYAPRTVANHLRWSVPEVTECLSDFTAGTAFELGSVLVDSFHTSHDTPESVGYRLTGDIRFALCTDLGCVTDEVYRGIEGASAVIIESNHDEEMLRYGPYPAYLKRRILSDSGHLSNSCCSGVMPDLVRSGARRLVLGHLSRENNTPEAARQAVLDSLTGAGLNPGIDFLLSVAAEAEQCVVMAEAGCECWG